jgi:hypothetical protein
MLTLNEALKYAGLPYKLAEEEQAGDKDVQNIYDSLVRGAVSPDEDITEIDEKDIKRAIKSKLEKGWTKDEIKSMLKWSEYFNVFDNEDTCRRKIKEVSDKVKARLAAVK